MFTDISGMRRGLIETSSTDVNSMCTSILWGVFQTHDKMEEFNKLNFADHPSIASEYTKFLATNAGHDSVEALAASVTSLTSDVSTLKTQLAEARRRADTASTKADAVDRLINPLTQRLKKLEVK
jgi:methyl-accepting chemotaxis protein